MQHKNRMLELDICRFVATFLVIMFHFVVEIPISNNFVLMWGRVGVGLFFVISGAGLINSCKDSFEIKKFYFKRIKAILIPFWVAYILVWAVKFIFNGFQPLFPGIPQCNLIYTVVGMDGYLSNFGVRTYYLLGEWYLGAILIVYFLFPIFRMVFLKFPKSTVVFLFALRAAIIYKNVFPIPVCFNIITAYSYFSIGALWVYNLRFKRCFSYRKWTKLIVALILMLSGSALGRVLSMQDVGELLCVIGVYYILCAYGVCCLKKTNIYRGVLWICSISYEVFLVHHVIIYAVAPNISAHFNAKTTLFGLVVIIFFIIATAYVLKKIVAGINTLWFDLKRHFNRIISVSKEVDI